MAASAPDDAVDFPYTRHSAPSAIAMRQLEETHHLPAAIQQRIGALIVYCNFIETLAEKVLWVLRQEDVRDQVPSTSQYKAGQIIENLRKMAAQQETSVRSAIELACETARHIFEYRNCVAHGEFLSIGNATQFVSNPGLWGERKRSTGAMALISERFLDTAIDAAATVHQTWLRVALEASGPSAGRAGAMTDTLEKLTSVRAAIAELCRNEAIRDLHLNGNLIE
ncbi:hypothetical protein [Burkholderia cenocepacia]|uniref:hypothetical protein n=1 Tax=Burkholderia cenocepacia TaxID=95486 RepID=UPI000D0C6BD0|nr:hypothetical protein [Burkholderia cenocepacia]SOT45991.1 hypothetical protein F01_560046 [Burkholderia cenocepacia]